MRIDFGAISVLSNTPRRASLLSEVLAPPVMRIENEQSIFTEDPWPIGGVKDLGGSYQFQYLAT